MAKKIIGPFTQILTMTGLPKHGAIADEKLELIPNASVLIEDGKISEIIPANNKMADAEYHKITEDTVLIPGLIDAHTHICFAGSRHEDYALRLEGKTYLEIAKLGGGILSTVKDTRAAGQSELEKSLFERSITHLKRGVTTCEVKSGYGLDEPNEIKILKAINTVDKNYPPNKNSNHSKQSPTVDLIPTCLAAHAIPSNFKSAKEYIEYTLKEILPKVKKENLSKRVDIFVEEGAFDSELAIYYLTEAKKLGFSLTVHADQFSQGGAMVAAQVGAISADHLEVSTIDIIEELARKNIIGVVLPGSSIGLGTDYAPARMMLDNNLCVAIASDWNPGSAPMGDLLLEAALISAEQKLSNAETLSAITIRAAMALELNDRGKLTEGMLADMIAFPCSDYREILYHQGSMKPLFVWKEGELLHK